MDSDHGAITAHDPVPQALAAIAAGRPVVVVHDEDREDAGDLVLAAQLATTDTMAFLIRHTSGFACVALPEDDCARLALPPMPRSGAGGVRASYRVTVDAVAGTTTGISAADRAFTARALADVVTVPTDLARPGHVVPICARDGGVLHRAGFAEAAVDLTRLAGQQPAGVLSEIVSRQHPGELARRRELAEFAAEHQLELISIAELAAYRRRAETLVRRETSVPLSTAYGAFRAIGYRGLVDGTEHLALVAGEVSGGGDILLHVHHECLTGDVLHSLRCACRPTLTTAMETVATSGGVVVYLRRTAGTENHEARADGDTLARQILADLGVGSTRCIGSAADGYRFGAAEVS